MLPQEYKTGGLNAYVILMGSKQSLGELLLFEQAVQTGLLVHSSNGLDTHLMGNL